MPTVTFSTGQKVNFAQNPSQEDIQEVADKLGVDKPQQSPVKQATSGIADYAKNTAKNILRGPATMIARPIQLGQVGVGELASKVTGNPQYADNAWNDVNTQHGLVKPLNQETPESIAGEGISTVALGKIPGASIPISGAITGAASLGGSAMQDNGSPLNVALNTAVGGGLGYLGGKFTEGLISKIKGPDSITDTLMKSGAATDPVTSKEIQQTLSGSGVSSLSDKEDIIFAKNTLSNYLRDAQQHLQSINPIDDVSGQPTQVYINMTNHINNLQKALSAVTQVGHYIAPGLIKRLGPAGIAGGLAAGGLLHDAVSNAGGYLYNKFVAPTGQNPFSASLK